MTKLRHWLRVPGVSLRMLAEDRAEQYKRDTDKVVEEINQRIRSDLRTTGDFKRVHPMPQSGADVPDDMDARLVILGTEHPYSRDANNKAQAAAAAILQSHGNTPRLFQNPVDHCRLREWSSLRAICWGSPITPPGLDMQVFTCLLIGK